LEPTAGVVIGDIVALEAFICHLYPQRMHDCMRASLICEGGAIDLSKPLAKGAARLGAIAFTKDLLTREHSTRLMWQI